MLLGALTCLAACALAQASASGSETQPGWIFKYFDEQRYNSSLQVEESTVDERLYNVVFLVNLVGTTIYQNLAPQEPAPGLEFDAAGCEAELRAMVAAAKDMSSVAERRRLGQGAAAASARLNETHLRLARVLDSYGRYESGGLSGRVRYLGSPSQCAESQLLLPQARGSARVDTSYCLAKLHLGSQIGRAPFEHQRHRYQPETDVIAGICIPKSCHTLGPAHLEQRNLLETLIRSQFKLPGGLYVEEELFQGDIYCGYDAHSELIQIPWSGKVLAALLASWLLLALLATLFKPRTRRLWLRDLIDALDLKLSLRDLLGGREQRSPTACRVDLDGLNGVKAAACAYVVFAHAMILYLLSSANPLKAMHSMENDPATMLVMSGSIVIDSFFVITGLLFAFVGLTKLKGSTSDNSCLSFAAQSFRLGLARYLRLVPLLYLAFWFKKTILLNVGSSVFWDYGYDNHTLSANCRGQCWLSPLSPAKAYDSITQLCITQSWSIYNDLFHCIALAPLIVLMARRPKLGAAIALLVALLSNYSMLRAFNSVEPAVRVSFQQLKFHALFKFFMEFGHVYTAPHCRIFATAIGIVAGSCLFHYQAGKLKWPGWFRVASWLSMLIVLLQLTTPLLVPTIKQNHSSANGDFAIDPPIMDFAMTGSRLIWAMANAIIFMRMTTDWRPEAPARPGSAGQLWRSLSRLNYPILLVHMDLLLIDAQLQTTIRYYSWYGVWSSFGATYLTSLALAAPIGHVYTAPHCRIFATAIGIVAGSCLFHYQAGKLKWPGWFRVASWLSMLIVLLQLTTPLLVPTIKQNHSSANGDFAIDPPIMDFAMTGSRLIWAMANAIIFMRMTTDWRPEAPARPGSAGQLWRSLSRLNYPILLVHMDLLLIDAQLQTTIRYYSWYGVWSSFGATYLTSLALAAPIHVLLENPLDKLLKLMVRKITSGEGSKRQAGARRCRLLAQQEVVRTLGRGEKDAVQE